MDRGIANWVGWLWAKHRISSNRNSHAVQSGQGAAMPRATPGMPIGRREGTAIERARQLDESTPKRESEPASTKGMHQTEEESQ